ncbi:ATP-binding protein [Paenibacillus chartarius]|uniref:histidine kinase n=1 Tax=Paenibacillus chartarius TaxID=747481 RepID=A0ABV6DFZ2_9BACL
MDNRITILGVDDRPENLLALEGVLSDLPYQFIPKHSGEDALRYLLKEDISDLAVILMDVQMPGLNGFETVKLIKQREHCREIPIIFLTAISTSMEHVLQGYSVGSIDYISKPIHPELLKLKVDAFVKLHQYRQRLIQQGELLQRRAAQLEDINRKLKSAEALIKSQYDHLEIKVQERTKELREANESLRLSQERFEKMFTASPCLMIIRRLSDMACLDVNESFKQYTGYGDEMIGTDSGILQAAPCLNEGESYDLHQSFYNVKVKYVTKQGEIRYCLVSNEVIEINNELCSLQVGLDITDKERYESEMARLGKLNLIGEMAAGIAHEIRNPMTTIRGFLQLSKETGRNLQQEYIDIMLTELDRANGIISEFLSLGKNKTTNRSHHHLGHIVQSLIPLIQAEGVMSGKIVREDCSDTGTLLLDEKEIRQLILNLSMNGLDAMTEGGELSIRTYSIEEYTILEIADQGSGISKEHMAKLGTPFFTTKDKGTGLGLAVCYSIAARHQARIEVKSSDKGTTFLVRFPVKVGGHDNV